MVNGSMALSCPKLDGELARARQRERLGAKIASLLEDAGRAEQRLQEQRTAARAAMDKASGELASIQPARVANSDAKALTRYLGALGLEVSPDRLNDLLVLLAVVMIEAGGGLSLAIGMALTGPAGGPTEAPTSKPDVQAEQPRTQPAAAPDAVATTPDTLAVRPERTRPATVVRPSGEASVAAWLRSQGGQAETSMRRLANTLGRSPSGVHNELRRMVASGLLTVVSGPRGTVLALTAAGRLN